MKNLRNISKISAIAFVLLLTFSATFVALPIVSAHDPPLEVNTWCYCVVSNQIIGVSQQQKIIFWLDAVPPTASGAFGDRWEFTVEITKPDGSKETIGPLTSDPVGSGYTFFTPAEVGTYTVVTKFPGDLITGLPLQPNWGPFSTGYSAVNDTYLASTSDPVTFTAQADPIPGWPEAPLPEDYWMRPINSANQAWWSLAANWMGGAAQNVGPTSNFNYGTGPESAHIMWVKPAFTGGLMDARFGNYGYVTSHYEGLYFTPLIIDGKLFYNAVNPQAGDGWYCVDLYSGETLYFHNTTGPVTGAGGGMFESYGGISGEALSFAQIYDPELGNQMGGYSYIWSKDGPEPNTWMMFDAFTGTYICSINNVPVGFSWGPFSFPWGTEVYGKDGSILLYNVVNTGTPTEPDYYLQCWNTTHAIWWKGTQQQWQDGDYSGFSGNNYYNWRPYRNVTYDGNNGYSLNVSIAPVQGSVQAVRAGEFIIGGTAGTNNEEGVVQGNLWCLSLERGKEGTLLWETTFTPPSSAGYKTISLGDVDPEDGVFVFYCTETRQRWGYSLETGEQIWESEPEDAMKYYGMPTNIYNGMLLTETYLSGGILYSYNITTGEILWAYEPKQIGSESPFGYYPITISCIADGKLYCSSTALWRTQPLWRGSYLRCINATDGEEIWKVMHYGDAVIADGLLVGLNFYDNRIYCYGKGPSATTVEAPMTTISLGDSVVIRGTVTDQCAGAKQLVEDGKFSSVPAISDEDQSAWMEYLYQQQAKPKDAEGVEVVITTLDPNGNTYELGRATSDINGAFGCVVEPPVPGKYQIMATFEGSASYYRSSASTYINVEEAPSPAQPIEPEVPAEPTVAEEPTDEPTVPEAPTEPEAPAAPEEPTETEPTEPEPTEPSEAPLITTEIAIIIAVVVVAIIGVVAFWALRKRK
jgi:hypothetical protein